MDSVGGMRILVRVVESGSFSAAARHLGVAPSSVSRQINELEEDLGARLFARTTRKLSLTEAGQLYYERSSSIINAVDEAKLALSQLGSPSGILRVTVPSGIGRELVASAVPAFLGRYPAIKIVLSMTDQMLDIVDAGIDVAIRVGRQQDSSFKARKIGESKRIVCGSPEYLNKAGIPKTPADLENQNCITWRDHPGHNTWAFRGPDGVLKVRVSGSFFAKSADALVAATVAGLGLSLLPDWNMGIELRQKQLCAVLTDFEASPATSPVYALHAHQRHVPPKIRVFIDFLIETFANARYS